MNDTVEGAPDVPREQTDTAFISRCETGALEALTERRHRLAGALGDWFAQAQRDLPWRRERTPYRTWVSEIMLQQTQVDKVVPYFERFCGELPDVPVLASASLDRVLKLWEGLGYYARARNLHLAARLMMERHDGQVPEDPKDLRRLPGMGPYTTAAVASLAFNGHVAVLDGNVRRVLARLAAIEEPPAAAFDRKVGALAKALLPEERAGVHNEALMELGALVCRPNSPRCDACPWSEDCCGHLLGLAERLPCKRARRTRPHYEVTAALIRNGAGEILIARRPFNGLLGGLWEFPGGKQEEGEDLESCLAREIREELDVEISVGDRLCVVEHAYSHFTITLHAFWARIVKGAPRPVECAALVWVRPDTMGAYAFSGADLKIIEALERSLPGSMG